MKKIETEAWVLEEGNNKLIKKVILFDELENDEVLLKPLYGCLEGNMIHAIENNPINIFKEREEKQIIMGNAGVLEVERLGKNIGDLKIGDKVIYFCNGDSDQYGYPQKITGYDKKGSMGVLAKKIKLKRDEILKIPQDNSISLEQWAAFSLKFITAWSNWKVAYNTWKIQMPNVKNEDIFVFGWGGGVTYAELLLAKKNGCKCFMITSKEENVKLCRENGIEVFNRKNIDKSEMEIKLLSYVEQKTGNKGVSIFVDNIGKEVYKYTIKALGRQGIITTSGWKTGGMLPILRQNECQNRHIHVFTHYAKIEEGIEAIKYASENNWLLPICSKTYIWNEIPKLIEEYKTGNLTTYFPIFKIN